MNENYVPGRLNIVFDEPTDNDTKRELVERTAATKLVKIVSMTRTTCLVDVPKNAEEFWKEQFEQISVVKEVQLVPKRKLFLEKKRH